MNNKGKINARLSVREEVQFAEVYSRFHKVLQQEANRSTENTRMNNNWRAFALEINDVLQKDYDVKQLKDKVSYWRVSSLTCLYIQLITYRI